MIAITGANGQLGRLVLDQLLQTEPAASIVALARKPESLSDYASQGVVVRYADYDEPASIAPALEGVQKLLLISSSDVGKRLAQHQAVIDAARQANVSLVAYTSILHAGSSKLMLAQEHRETEAALAASGLNFTLLRNGWYTENYAATAAMTIEQGTLYGCAGDGRFSCATRTDYAAAAAAVLTSSQSQAGKVYELAGDDDFTLSQFAQELSKQSDKAIAFHNMSQNDFQAMLTKIGLPEGLAMILADSEAGASRGALFDKSGDLSMLIGRPTTSYADAVRQALAQ